MYKIKCYFVDKFSFDSVSSSKNVSTKRRRFLFLVWDCVTGKPLFGCGPGRLELFYLDAGAIAAMRTDGCEGEISLGEFLVYQPGGIFLEAGEVVVVEHAGAGRVVHAEESLGTGSHESVGEAACHHAHVHA